MRRKWLVIVGSVCVAAVFLYFLAPVLVGRLFFGPGGGRGPVMDHWDVANKTIRVRVTVYEEKNPVLLHRFNYVFEASPVASNSWREVFDTWTDDDIPIPRDSVHFLNDNAGYLTMGETFAVTIDGGRTWSIWDARKKISNWQCCNQTFIKEVHVASDGKGQMILQPRFHGLPMTTVYTKDFGVNWNSQ